MTLPGPDSTPGNYCHLCGSGPSLPIEGFEALARVTSDCKGWPAGGHLFLCTTCGTIHKNVDAVWLEEIARIYADYSIYHLSGGVEQPVFVAETDSLMSRSARIMEQLVRAITLPERGRLLDIGCGNGSFLKTFTGAFPHWTMTGTEFNTKYKTLVESIPQVETVHTGPVSELPGMFQLQTMVHVLEHIPWPARLLLEMREKLDDGGYLVLDLPDHQLNPFDLVVADHCTHFTPESVNGFLAHLGFETLINTPEWIRKERVVVARGQAGRSALPAFSIEAVLAPVTSAISYLESCVQTARRLRQNGSLGVFGTSIAGTWLHTSLTDEIDFWVEEDPSRLGRNFMGKPIYLPQDAPAGTQILVALAPALSRMLRQKFAVSCAQATWFVPDQL